MTKFWTILALVILLVAGIWYYFHSAPTTNAPDGGLATSTSVTYNNTAYGFSVSLPADWNGYTVDHKEWNGQVFDKSGQVQKTDSGALISVSAPAAASDTQPIPVMIFTHTQWNLILAGDNSTSSQYMAVSAAPIPPSELGENSKYVFAIPARYNYAYVQGWEKTDAIVQDKSAWSFFEPAGISFTSPKSGDVWNVGQTYRVSWLGGGDKVTLFLVDKHLAETAGASVSIVERFYSLPNIGYYDYAVKSGLSGTYSWSITDLVQSATSSFFTIK